MVPSTWPFSARSSSSRSLKLRGIFAISFSLQARARGFGRFGGLASQWRARYRLTGALGGKSAAPAHPLPVGVSSLRGKERTNKRKNEEEERVLRESARPSTEGERKGRQALRGFRGEAFQGSRKLPSSPCTQEEALRPSASANARVFPRSSTATHLAPLRPAIRQPQEPTNSGGTKEKEKNAVRPRPWTTHTSALLSLFLLLARKTEISFFHSKTLII